MASISSQDFFKADDLPSDAVLSGEELRSAFWQLKKIQREAAQQQTFWKSLNSGMADAYAKLASVQAELKSSREALQASNAALERKVAERTAALRHAQEFAENVVASISELLLVVDVDGQVLEANRAFVDRVGVPREGLLGRSVHELIASDPERSPELPGDWLEIALREGELRSCEAVCRAGSEAPILVAFSASRLRDSGGRVLGAVCLARDVTERRRAERELREQLDRIRAQEETIRALVTPVIRVWSSVLVLPIVGSLDRGRVSAIMDDLLRAVNDSRSAFAVLDLTGVWHVDAETADHLIRITRAVALLGARCVVSGLSPSAAQSFTQLGADLRDLVTFGNLDAALRHALVATGELPGAAVSRRRKP